MKFLVRALALLMVLVVPALAFHAFNQSYIYLRIDNSGVNGRVEVNLSDLNRAVGTEFPTDLKATRADIEPDIERVREYLFNRVAFAVEGESLEVVPGDFDIFQSAGSQYVAYDFDLPAVDGVPDDIDITHNLIFEVDPQHRGFVVIEHFFAQGRIMNEGMISLTFDPGSKTQNLDLTDTSIWRGVFSLTKLGVHHILIGIDHILFLLVLLLPSVLQRDGRAWTGREKFSSSLVQVLKIVTVFTLAHSVTLSLAALNILTLPSRLVESIIALSIAVAAIDLIIPVFRDRILLVVLLFGFFHGFGFANVLGEMGISGLDMAYSLLGFNIGVEIGQLAIVVAVFPFLFMMRLSKLYTHFMVQAGAAVAIFISIYWFIERGFDVNLTLGEYLAPVLNFF